MPRVSNEQIRQPTDTSSVNQALEYLGTLAKVAVGFARVERMPRYPDGKKETDAEHSFHLSLSATELAATYFPDLDVGLVAQFSLVHDLPELYVGDTPTFNISDGDRAKKEQAEKAAHARLLSELPPYTAQLLERYERQEEPEARFVRLVDKVLPPLIVAVSNTGDLFKDDYSLTSLSSLRIIRDRESVRLIASFPEFPFIQMVRALVIKHADAELFLQDGQIESTSQQDD